MLIYSNADVDNPEVCHAHSEIPDTWPPIDEILEYQTRVRERVRFLSLHSRANRKVGRALWLAFEHEAMHLETFLYMLLQSDRVIPPPGRPLPDFKSMALNAGHARVPNQWHRVPKSEVVLGLDDPENDLGPDRYFAWDNERPSRRVTVDEFEAQARPISNGEYARFLEFNHVKSLPASWSHSMPLGGETNGITDAAVQQNGNGHLGSVQTAAASEAFVQGKFVRTVYGLVPL